MRTAHLANSDFPDRTACGEPWEDWQEPDQGASMEEVLAVPMTQPEKAEIRAAERERRGVGPVRQCQACLRQALGR